MISERRDVSQGTGKSEVRCSDSLQFRRTGRQPTWTSPSSFSFCASASSSSSFSTWPSSFFKTRPFALQFLGLLGFLLPLGENLSVLSSSESVLLASPPLKGESVALALQHDWGYEPLYFRGSKLLLLAILQRERPLDYVLANIIFLCQVEKLPNLAGSLRSQPPWDGVVGKSGDLSLTLLDNCHGKNSKVSIHNTSANRFPLTLSITSWSVTGSALLQEESHTAIG